MTHQQDSWLGGDHYDQFMGRWSRLIGARFLDWLSAPAGVRWLDVGCGTGALTQQVLKSYQPAQITGIDPSTKFIAHARKSIPDPLAEFIVGSAEELDIPSDSVQTVVSGLALNFVPRPEAALAEMLRVTKPWGQIGIYLWDYAEGMEMLRYFWDAAVSLDPAAGALDEGKRFPLCAEGALEKLVRKSGLVQVEAVPIVALTRFNNFDDFWQPFLTPVGPAPGYTMNLEKGARERLADQLRNILPVENDGSIKIKARAWAVKGINA